MKVAQIYSGPRVSEFMHTACLVRYDSGAGLTGKETGYTIQEGQDSMKVKLIVAAVTGLILLPSALIAQAPPAGATGKCKDGTYSTAASKSGACRGHKGVDTWYAPAPPASSAPAAPAAKPASAPSPAPPAKPASAPAPAAPSTPTKSTPSKTPVATKTVAPGGGPGLVWLNTNSKVYHCYGGADYGTTKAGKYMSEADAKTAGGKPAGGKACSTK